jgi:hypothetical protein
MGIQANIDTVDICLKLEQHHPITLGVYDHPLKISGEASQMARDVTLAVLVQEEIDNTIQANTAALNEEQLQNHFQEINTRMVALTQRPTTNRLNKLLKATSVRNSAKLRVRGRGKVRTATDP